VSVQLSQPAPCLRVGPCAPAGFTAVRVCVCATCWQTHIGPRLVHPPSTHPQQLPNSPPADDSPPADAGRAALLAHFGKSIRGARASMRGGVKDTAASVSGVAPASSDRRAAILECTNEVRLSSWSCACVCGPTTRVPSSSPPSVPEGGKQVCAVPAGPVVLGCRGGKVRRSYRVRADQRV
jgi:hypothetical protein